MHANGVANQIVGLGLCDIKTNLMALNHWVSVFGIFNRIVQLDVQLTPLRD